MYRFALEKTSKKFPCPGCGRRTFTRVIDHDTGGYLPDDVGRCDREVNCGYSLTSREHFEMLRNSLERKTTRVSHFNKPKPFDYIEMKHALDALDNYDQNGFVTFLLNLFPYDKDAVQEVLARYVVGTYPNPYGAYTLLPYFDTEKRLCYGKLIRFNPETGRRGKGEYDTGSLRTKLKLDPFNRKVTFFGEHLLSANPGVPIGIVESEKSAIIATVCDSVFPEMLWLAAGSLSVLTPERLARSFRGRKIVLYPDAGAFDVWNAKAVQARQVGLDVVTSDLIEIHATDEEMHSGFDIADYLIREQRALNLDAAESEAFYLEANRLI